jgi:GNAT superfamily N-acetyltransferase
VEKQFLTGRPMPIHRRNIRAATPEDIPTIFNLIEQLAEYEKLAHMVSGNTTMLADALFGAQPSCECCLVADDEKIVGFAIYFTTFSTFLCKRGLYLEDLFIIPEARGRGHGKALLIYLSTLAQQRQCGRFEWRVLDWNKPSIDFYRSLGASILPEWHLVRLTDGEFTKLAAAASSLR